MITIFLLTLFSAILVFFYYKKTNPPISSRLKWILGVLRFLFFLIVLILLINPILHLHNEKYLKPFTAIAVDISKSMNQKLEAEKAKSESANEWSQKLKDFFDTNKIAYQTYNFGNGLENDTNRTDIFLSLSQIQKKEKNRNLSDIILISDGLNHNNNNYPLIEQINTPVSVVELGEIPHFSDLAIKKIVTNNPVYLNTETEIEIVLENTHEEQTILAKLWDNDKLISEKKFKDVEKSDEIIISYFPTEIGFKKLRIALELENENEINLTNNQREFLLNVVKNRAQILLITSQLNWDISFINRALTKNENLKINLVEKRKNGYYFENEKADILDLLTECELLIMHNKDEFNLTNKEYDEIKNFVKRGGNLIYFDEIDSQLGDILPLEKSKYSEEIEANISLTNTSADYQSFAFGKTDKETQKICENLPPISTYFYSPQNNSEVLAIANLQTRNPVIAVYNYFNGNVLMFAGNGFYRWKMWEELQNIWFDEFFNSLVNWLINTDIKKRFLCTTNKMQYMIGEPVEFSALLFDERMNPMPKQNILLKIQNTDKIIEKYLTEENNEYEISITNLADGKYNYEAECLIGSHKLVSKGEFLVDQMPLEDSSTGMNSSFLNFVSSKTDGKTIRLENDFAKLLNIERESREVHFAKEIELWKKWYVPVLAILILSIELFIRKRKGLL